MDLQAIGRRINLQVRGEKREVTHAGICSFRQTLDPGRVNTKASKKSGAEKSA